MNKLLIKIVEMKIRLDRGNALVIWLRNIVLIVAGMYIVTGKQIGRAHV